VTPQGDTMVLLDSRARGAYINDFIRVGDLLIMPNWKPGSLTAYRIMTGMLTDLSQDRLPPQMRRAFM